MPETPIFGFPFEAPTDKPGISVTGVDGNEVLAESVETVLSGMDSRLSTAESEIDSLQTTAAQVPVIEASFQSSNRGYVATSENAVNTGGTWSDLATLGPQATISTESTFVLVFFGARTSADQDNVSSQMSFAVTGATTIAAGSDVESRIVWDGVPLGNTNTSCTFSLVAINAGTNTFTAKYLSGLTHTSTFAERKIYVMPLFG